MARYDDREAEENPDGETTENRGETTPAIAQLAPQTIVESDSPREADLVLADEPLVRVGLARRPRRIPLRQHHRRRPPRRRERRHRGPVDSSRSESSTPAGGTFGRAGAKGEGPGEYEGLRLMRGCPGAAVTAYDGQLDRITELDSDGVVAGHTGVTAGPARTGYPHARRTAMWSSTAWPDTEWDARLKPRRWVSSIGGKMST